MSWRRTLLALAMVCVATSASAQDYLVSGAGTEAVNGMYTYEGDQGGKPYYRNGDYRLGYSDMGAWVIAEGALWYESMTPDYGTLTAGDTPPDTGWIVVSGTAPAPSVMEACATLIRDGATFTESTSDDGTITNTLTITYLLPDGDSFSGSNGIFDSSKYASTNVPDGLSVAITRNNDTELSVALAGAATEHLFANSITNMEIAFLDAAFTGGDASAVNGATQSNLAVEFRSDDEFLVNTWTDDNQAYPAVAGLADGGFIVTWSSTYQDGDLEGIFAQRYDSDGGPVGNEFQVNTYTNSTQRDSSVAGLADGGYVVAWHSYGQDGAECGIYAQRFDADGVATGGEFRVNTYTLNDQSGASVAALSDGGFVIAWFSAFQDGDWDGVFAQRYDSDGAAVSNEFQVNTYTAKRQDSPSVAALNDGGFVIAWRSEDQDGSEDGVYAQRYDSDGAAVGSEFRVNTCTNEFQDKPSAAALSDGGFVVTWMSFAQDGDCYGIYGQRYDSDGVAVGGEFQANTYTNNRQWLSSVAGLEDGGFVVTWDSFNQDGDNYGIYGQRYDAAGAMVGGEFRVNTTTTGEQSENAVAPLTNGAFVAAWMSWDQDGNYHGICAGMSTPLFARGDTTTLEVEADSAPVSIDNVLRTRTLCQGDLTWSIAASPTNGTLTGFPVTQGGANYTIVPTNTTYQPTGGYTGSDSFTIEVTDGDATTELTVDVTVGESGKLDQTIGNFMPANGSAFVTTDTVGLSATASSGLDVTFAVQSGPGEIGGGTNLSFSGAGTVVVTADQAGNAEYNPAPTVRHVYRVTVGGYAERVFRPSYSLEDLDGTTGFRLDGIGSPDCSGCSVSDAGDVNGDGYADVIVGAKWATPSGQEYAGASYVVFGKTSGWAAALDLSALDGTNGFRLTGIDAEDYSGFSVSDAGDVNGDGYADVIVGAYCAEPSGQTNAGESYVVFGEASGWASALDLSALDGTNGFRLDGIDTGDESGRSVGGAGDVNGDGYADLIIGAFMGDPGGVICAGESYVVFGKASGWASALDLSALDGTNGFRLDGIDAGDDSGYSVSGAGDVNGDGYADVIVGALGSDPGGDNDAGESYVVFGNAAGWAATVDLSALDGTNGFRLDGIDAEDYAGFTVSDAGDVNGDGYSDVIVGAYKADPGGNSNAGESYVVFGKASGWAAELDLSALDGTNGFRLDGIDALDYSGYSVSGAGDVNGDGYADVIVGAMWAAPSGLTEAGESYVVFGKPSGWDAALDLAALDGTNGFRLDGIDANDKSGCSVSGAGDVNGDGYADVIVGALAADPGGVSNAGESYIFFGGALLKTEQTIESFLPADGAEFITTNTVGLSAAASSGLPVTFAVHSGPGSLDGTNLSFTAAGTVKVTADQPGNAAYYPAPTLTNTYTVSWSCELDVDNGPSAGGNSITITADGPIGDGSDITNVTVCGVVATITAQSENCVTVTLGAGPSGGATGDIVIESAGVGTTTFDDAYTYNPAGQMHGAGAWTEVAGLPEPTVMHGVAALDGALYAVGGVDAFPPTISLDSCYRFNGTNWAPVADLPAPRSGHAVCAYNGKLYAIGGNLDPDGGAALSNVYAYAGGAWTEVAPLPQPRSKLSAVAHGGLLYALGGTADGSEKTNVFAFDGATWQEVAGLPAMEGESAVAAGVAGGLLHYGYFDGSENAETYAYDGESWNKVGSFPYVAYYSSAGHDGRLFVMGGFDLQYMIPTDAVSSFDGAAWRSEAALPAPVLFSGGGSLDGSLYCVGGMDAGFAVASNVYRYTESPAVNPASGSLTGGYQVVISGSNLGDGSDVTNVTLCGVSVDSIDSQSATQVVVTAGQASSGGVGDVRVLSTSYGETVQSNAFEYTSGKLDQTISNFLPANGSAFVTTDTVGLSATASSGLDVRFAVQNGPGLIGGGTNLSFSGAGTVVVTADQAGNGSYNPAPTMTNSYTVTLPYELSFTSGPCSGSATFVITNCSPAVGNGSDITNVTVCGVQATILEQGEDWVVVTLGPSPDPTQAVTGDIVIQSTSEGETVFENAYTYNPAGEIGLLTEDWSRWQPVEGLPAPMAHGGAGVLQGRLFVSGGVKGYSSYATNSAAFDGDTWSVEPASPLSLQAFGAATYGGAFYTVAGHAGLSKTNGVQKYDGTNWTTAAPLPERLSDLGAAALGGHLYAVGGHDGSLNNSRTNVFRFDGSSWTEVAGLPEARRSMGVAEYNGALYAIGGRGDGSSSSETNVYRFDGSSWTEVAGLPEAKSEFAVATLRGDLYVIAGQVGFNGSTTVHRFDGTNWMTATNYPLGVYGLAAAELNGYLYAAGGTTDDFSDYPTNAYRYPWREFDPGVNPSSGSWTGGYHVVISGSNLGDGSDVTNVTLCGVSVASIDSQSATQVVVTAGQALSAGMGDVRVFSTSYGETVKINAFEYLNVAPSIGGTVAGQAVDDNATIEPFTTVTIDDTDDVSLTVTLDDAAKGNLLNLGSFSDDGGGVYSLAAMDAAAAQSALRSLTFDPAENRVVPGSTETTVFTIAVSDGLAESSNNNASVIAASINDMPLIVMDDSSIPFALGGLEDDSTYDIALDGDDNIVMVGYYNDVIDMDPGPGTYALANPYDDTQSFVAKYDTSGALLWAHGVGGDGSDERAVDVAIDTNGYIYVTGQFEGTADFNGTNLTATTLGGDDNDDVDTFVWKLSPGGATVWVRQLTGGHDNDDCGRGIAVRGSDVFVTGEFSETTDFDPGVGTFEMTPFADSNDEDVFLLKLTTGGEFVWARQLGSDDNDRGYAVGTDTDGNVLIGGCLIADGDGWDLDGDGSADMYPDDPGGSDGAYSDDDGDVGFLVKYDGDGSALWRRFFFATDGCADGDDSCVSDLKVDDSGSVFAVGAFDWGIDFNPDPDALNAEEMDEDNHGFMVKLDANGEYQWHKRFGEAADDTGDDITIDKTWCSGSGHLYLTGDFTGQLDADPDGGTNWLSATGHDDVFVIKLDATGAFLWAKTFGGENDDSGDGFAEDSQGNVFFTGDFEGVTDIHPDANRTLLKSSNGGEDLFLARLTSAGDTVLSVTFAENGTGAVHIVTANDPDTGDSLIFGIGGTDSNRFNIVSSNGVLRFNTPPDYELPEDADGNNVYELYIVASDGSGASDEVLMTVSVTDLLETYTLTVQSDHGLPLPGVGVHTNMANCVVTNIAGRPIVAGATQYVCAGWIMTGHAPESGSTPMFEMTVTNDAVLTWLWSTNYWLDTEAGAHGAVSPADDWYALGSNVAVEATADTYYHFTHWTGDASGSANPLDVTMHGPKTVGALFAENLATNDTPEWWLASFGWTNDFDAAALDDQDDDGMPTWGERIAGTIPTNMASVLRVSDCAVAYGTNYTEYVYTNELEEVFTQRLYEVTGQILEWPSVSGRLYRIDWRTDLMTGGWEALPDATNLPATPPSNTHTDKATTVEQRFYRIGVRLP